MNTKDTLMQSLMLAFVSFCNGNVIITSTFTTLEPFGYLQCASMCLEYSACEAIFYSKDKLDCRLNYLNNDIMNYLPSYFETFKRVSRSTIRQLPSFNNDSATGNGCPKIKRRIMLKNTSFVCIGVFPADPSLHNAAVNKPTSQSSDYGFYSRSNKAVDGISASAFGYCSSTLEQSDNLWWMVDLVQLYHIYKITIQNRGDCCGGRLSYFTVDVGVRTDELNVVGYYRGVVITGDLVKFSFELPMFGRYVRIAKASKGTLTICEVTVYAHCTQSLEK